MKTIDKAVDAADRLQRRWAWLAFPVAVWKKFTDDHAGRLAALISYYGFAATFPLLLVLVTVLNITLKNNPALHHGLLTSALAQYPVIGQYIHLNSLPETGLPLAIGIVFLVFGARGLAGAMQNALCEVWDVPEDSRPGFPWSQIYGMALVFAVGIGLLVTTFLSGLAGGAGHVLTGAGAHIGAVAVSLVLNIGVFWLSFRLATAGRVPWHDLRIGAAIAAVVWQVLQIVGGYVVSHQLHRASSLYGAFGVVLGMLAWLYLQAEVTLYAAELDVVLVRRLWPRSIKPGSASPEGRPPGPSGDNKERGARDGRAAA